MTDIIQLRQSNSNNVYKNGEYEITLPHEVVLNPGDEMTIKNVFIDSTTINAGDIFLNDDLELDLNFLLCQNNWISNGKDYKTNNNNNVTAPDNKPYIICENKQSSSNLFLVDYVIFTAKDILHPDKMISFEFSYQNVNGDYHHKIIKVNKSEVAYNSVTINGKKYKRSYKVNLNILCTTYNWTHISSKTYGVYINTTKEEPVNSDVLHPIINTSKIYIQKGSYDPELFCEIFNKQLTAITNYKIGTKLLFKSDICNYTEPTTAWANAHRFVRYDANGIYTVNTSSTNYFLYGSNQVALEFDNDKNLFRFINHFPMYNSSGSIMVEFANNEPVGFNGLALLTSISSKFVNSNQKINFFEDVLGFDINKLFVNIDYKNVQLEGSTVYSPYLTNLNLGDNYSNALISPDTFVDKTSANSFIKINVIDGTKVLTNDLSYIFADKKLSNITPNPYYLIEIDNFNNSLNSPEYLTHKIAGIVGRYYSVNNYTQGDISTSIPIINTSNRSILFNSLKVKISNGTGDNDIDIGPDNTVFLIIQRGKYQEEYNKKMIELQNKTAKQIKKNPYI